MGEMRCCLRTAREGSFVLKTFSAKCHSCGPEENRRCVTTILCNNQPKPLYPSGKSLCKLMVFSWSVKAQVAPTVEQK